MRVNEIHSPILLGGGRVWVESTTGLGHTYEYSTHIPLNPKPGGQQKTTNEIHESTYPNPPIGQLTEPRDAHWQF